MTSGVLLGLSFPPFPFSLFAWFAFVPLLLGLRTGTSARAAFVDAYVAMLVTFAIAFHWPLLHEMRSTALMSLPPLLVIPMWMSIPFGLAHAVKRRHGMGAGLLAWVTLTILAEYGLQAGPLAFPWTLIGHTQAVVTPVNGLAALGGVPLLSLVVLCVNSAIYLTIRQSLTHKGRSAAFVCSVAVVGIIIIAASASYSASAGGEMRVSEHARAAEGPMGREIRRDGVESRTNVTLNTVHAAGKAAHIGDGPPRIAGIQPALSPVEWADLADSSRVTLLLRLSSEAASSDSTLQFIIWPETAVPPLPASRRYFDRMQSFVDSARVPLIAGAITTADAGSAYRNSAVLFAPRVAPRTYHKINLVPFAERVPFSGVSSALDRFAVPSGGVPGYEPGENRRIFEIPYQRFGVLICFETLFSAAARSYVLAGAEMLIAITQDGWWGDSFGYRQHLAFNRLRAIETDLPMIQSAVSGISAVIHPDGRVDELAGWMERAVWTVDVPPPVAPPPYVRLGDWVTLIAACLSAVAAVFYTIRFVHMQRKSNVRHAP